ncbi:hypothetical protein HOLleu_44624 [Holothuria leucospilota]|uniref:Uncharacterized protein n=1 Tax=Holothuria leucospilota TaxID=206669 RepID=A0A9Q1B996_HOLLE|nr:hypothetical protein HOLleu_44624 [Holothuria leucospilota]
MQWLEDIYVHMDEYKYAFKFSFSYFWCLTQNVSVGQKLNPEWNMRKGVVECLLHVCIKFGE